MSKSAFINYPAIWVGDSSLRLLRMLHSEWQFPFYFRGGGVRWNRVVPAFTWLHPNDPIKPVIPRTSEESPALCNQLINYFWLFLSTEGSLNKRSLSNWTISRSTGTLMITSYISVFYISLSPWIYIIFWWCGISMNLLKERGQTV